MALTTLVITKMLSPVYIGQGCKIHNILSLGSYSTTRPKIYIEATAIQHGSITTSTSITAGANI